MGDHASNRPHGVGTETICAIATPPGVGGVGIVRISGPASRAIGVALTGSNPTPRFAHFSVFRSGAGEIIDSGLILYFPAPNSFTGEDVVELQGHGGPVVMNMLLQQVLDHGARLARPGEFAERAFLNDKIDLAQAEAIADLIESGTESAARAAQRSLQGEFSSRVQTLLQALIELRVFVESAIDFPDEEVDFLADSDVLQRLDAVAESVLALQDQARQGQLLRDGITLAIIGRPNAGKSSLLNALSGRESAIVTDIPGTTRDVLREQVAIDGLPVHLADTAGIRDTGDAVEAEGVRRARAELDNADLILLVIDTTAELISQMALKNELPSAVPVITVFNKIDRAGEDSRVDTANAEIWLSARSGDGIGRLTRQISDTVGRGRDSEGTFTARTRHLDALKRVQHHLRAGREQYLGSQAGELLAEELRLAQQALSEITGEYTSDDLLGAIFSSFCIGK